MSIEKYIENYINKLIKVNNQLEHMDSVIRPRNNNNNPGGVVNLKNDIPTMIIPDLHNRLEFLNKILNYKPHNQTVKELLKSNKIQIVFVGDAFHSESAQRDRWLKAYEEYESRFKEHKYMDEEMFSNLKLMEIIIDLKIENPKNVYFLKGNHENVLNEDCEGNRPFGKFVLEGEMVKSWIEKFCSEEFLVHYYRYEKLLPLLAIGENFLVSHAEPLESYTVDQVINCYIDPTIIYGLTWTKNDASQNGSVNNMLKMFLEKRYISSSYYFAGHRTIDSLYRLRANGRFVQIHNPKKYIVAYLNPGRNIQLTKDIFEL